MHSFVVHQVFWAQLIHPYILEIVVINAEPSRILLLFIQQGDHANLICLRGVSFGKASSRLDFAALFLVLQNFAFHSIGDLISFEEAELVRWQEFGNISNFVSQICVRNVL